MAGFWVLPPIMNRRIAKGRNFSREQLFHFPHQIREFPQGFLHRGGVRISTPARLRVSAG